MQKSHNYLYFSGCASSINQRPVITLEPVSSLLQSFGFADFGKRQIFFTLNNWFHFNFVNIVLLS